MRRRLHFTHGSQSRNVTSTGSLGRVLPPSDNDRNHAPLMAGCQCSRNRIRRDAAVSGLLHVLDGLERRLKMSEIDVDALAAGTACFAAFNHLVNLLMESDSPIPAADIQRLANPGGNHV